MSDTRERCVHGWVDPLEWCTSCMAARIAELEEAARRYFNADGSVSLMVSAEAVVEARKADARRIAELEAQVGEGAQAHADAEMWWSSECSMRDKKIAELEARVLRMRLALEWAHEREGAACACGEAGEHPEDCPVANALSHPLIGGAK